MQPDNFDSPFNRSFKVALVLTCVSALIIGTLFFLANANKPEIGKTGPPAILRIGVLPDQNPEILYQRFEPVLDYLSSYLQLRCELVVPESYEQMLKLFHDQEIDLAYFGGYSFTRAQQMDGAVPLVMRRIDTRFTSLFIVATDSPVQTLDQLEGKDMAFGSRLSTSGHLMPRYFLQQKNINPESFFSSVQYSGAHDKTAFWVRDGKVDVGVANATTIRSMLDKNLIKPNEIRILWETPPYANYVWAIHPKFTDSLRSRIHDAFLQLSTDDANHAIVLENLNAIGYLPADSDFFTSLATIASNTEILSDKRQP
jgi:phosphonate transport system substrate-binding protein